MQKTIKAFRWEWEIGQPFYRLPTFSDHRLPSWFLANLRTSYEWVHDNRKTKAAPNRKPLDEAIFYHSILFIKGKAKASFDFQDQDRELGWERIKKEDWFVKDIEGIKLFSKQMFVNTYTYICPDPGCELAGYYQLK